MIVISEEIELSKKTKDKSITIKILISVTISAILFILISILLYFFIERMKKSNEKRILPVHKAEKLEEEKLEEEKIEVDQHSMCKNDASNELNENDSSNELNENDEVNSTISLSKELYKAYKNVKNLDDLLSMEKMKLDFIERYIKFNAEDRRKVDNGFELFLNDNIDSDVDNNNDEFNCVLELKNYCISLEDIAKCILCQYYELNTLIDNLANDEGEDDQDYFMPKKHLGQKKYIKISPDNIKKLNDNKNQNIDIELLNSDINFNIEMNIEAAEFIKKDYDAKLYEKELLDCVKEFSEYIFQTKEKIKTANIQFFKEAVNNAEQKTIEINTLSPFVFVNKNVLEFYSIDLDNEQFFFTKELKKDIEESIKHDSNDIVVKTFSTCVLKSFVLNFFCYEKIRLISERFKIEKTKKEINLLLKKENSFINKSKIGNIFLFLFYFNNEEHKDCIIDIISENNPDLDKEVIKKRLFKNDTSYY